VLPVGLERDSLSAEAAKELRQATLASAAKSGAVLTDFGPIDADLATVLGAWSTLPNQVRAGIVAMVKAALDQK
jgi:hypothetical protein